MTAVREDGQVYFTFEEVDFEGAAKELSETCMFFLDQWAQADKHGSVKVASIFQKKYWDHIRILRYVNALKEGVRYA